MSSGEKVAFFQVSQAVNKNDQKTVCCTRFVQDKKICIGQHGRRLLTLKKVLVVSKLRNDN
jgi:hypothetical protein